MSLHASVFVFGNPLLDMIIETNDAYLNKWKVESGKIYLAENHHLPLYDELKQSPDVKFLPGGAAQNTARGIQWILGTPNATTYVGTIGKDNTASLLRKHIDISGVQALYVETDKAVTGVCAVLVNGPERTLIAKPGACNYLELCHMHTDAVSERVNAACIFYAAGFVLDMPQKLDVALYIGKHCAQYNKIFVFNIGAPFVPEFYLDRLQGTLPYCDFVIANEQEAKAYAIQAGLKTDQLSEIAQHLVSFKKQNCHRQRTVIITQGPLPTVLAHQGTVVEYEPPMVNQDDIVDTNGAGDAFAAGLIAGLIRDVSIEKAIEAAQYAARDVIFHSGAEYSKQCGFTWPNNSNLD